MDSVARSDRAKHGAFYRRPQPKNGFQLSGLLLQAHQDAPYVVRYSIDVDEAWRTRAVQVEVENDGRHRTSLVTNGSGRWSRDAEILPDLDDCLGCRPGVVAVDEHASHPAPRTCPGRDEAGRYGLGAVPVPQGAASRSVL